MELVYLFSGILIGIVATYLFTKQKLTASQAILQNQLEKQEKEFLAEKTALEKENSIREERIRSLQQEKEAVLKSTEQLREEKETAEKQIVALRSEYKHLQEKLDNERSEIEKLQEKFKTEFQNVANTILKQNTREFNETSQKNMSDLLNPLKEKITAFEKKVEETYQKGKIDQTILKEELKRLQELNAKLGEEAGNLTKALKSDPKKQGNWGEVVLERILESSGLIKNEEYFLQQTTTGEGNKIYRPDVVIKLPENKHLVIDSKVSLTAFQQYIGAEDKTQKEQFLKQHLHSIRNHVKELSEKNYQNLKELNTPDFVLMFMPVEPAFGIAVQADADLFNFAWEKRIVIVSPTTLLATLRTVASIWSHEKQTRNALEIAKQGGKLYDKFEGFLKDLEKIGDNLNKAQMSYTEAHKKLVSGRGNLLGQVEKLKTMGAKATKQIDKKYLEE
ncbi:DNA recombination protein RmuC [Candidatus Sulfidibacterium hydrothermale]|uniref:DNA recombination protein RmuC n=1 Tax=Candidatus Sulfidibacterium hydrothermale TaxID=2875962 RepID=UPI001F0B16D1|nr:DNA recombination protein RmuC [Candidatus Sulfidibacterium hydrothermale]UBM63486.1 DNA recombination protein RmuC [Candidatus Sulfidibacterium hydrothermale]